MRVLVGVGGAAGGSPGDVRELGRWLRRHPELSDRVRSEAGDPPGGGVMGTGQELMTVLLAPGGVTAALAAAVVSWLRSRRGGRTVTITLADGTQVSVAEENLREGNAEAEAAALRIVEAVTRAQAAAAAPAAAPPATAGEHGSD